MKIFAYLYSDPLLESAPDQNIWGLEIDKIYQDLGDHQQLEQLICDCAVDCPKYVLVRRLEELGDDIHAICDRLGRLESLDATVITTEQNYNSQQWNQLDVQDLKESLSQLFQEVHANKQSIRLKQGHARNRFKILPPPGKAPYGYRRGRDRYIIDKSTAPVVKEFFERFILFGSLRGAVRYLEKRFGKKISPATGKNWLTNPVYRGNLRYKNQAIISHTHTAILNAEEAAQIDRLLRRNRHLPPRTASAPRSLAGLVICGNCQLTMQIVCVTQHHKANKYLYLRCLKCPQQPKCSVINYSQVLEQTIAQICQELPQAVGQLESSGVIQVKDALQQQITQKQTTIANLSQLLEQQILDQDSINFRAYQLRTEISQLEQQLAQLPPPNLLAIAQTVSLRQFWLDLSEAERRFYFREFIKQIVIMRDQGDSWQIKLDFVF